MPGDYFCKMNGRSFGPVSAKHLRYLAQYGKLSPDDLVRKDGSEEWLRAGSIATLFPANPPSATPPEPAPPVPPSGAPRPHHGTSPASSPSEGNTSDAPAVRGWAAAHQRAKRRPHPFSRIIGIASLGLFVGLILLWLVFFRPRVQETIPEDSPGEQARTTKTEPVARTTRPADHDQTKNQPANLPHPAKAKPSPSIEEKKERLAQPPKPVEKVQPTPEVKAIKALTREELFQRCAPSVALIRGRASAGTGFVVGPDLLATNAHVIRDELEADLKVHFPHEDGAERRARPAKVVFVNRTRDLALLSVKSAQRPLQLAKGYRFRPAQDVLVIGCPGLSRDLILENAVSAGVMSTKTRLDGLEYFQLNMAINPGNSGGPVLDMDAQVIGVIAAKAAKQEGIAFCIPVDDLIAAIDQSAKQSEADRKARIKTKP